MLVTFLHQVLSRRSLSHVCRVCPRRGTGSTILCVEKGRQCGMWDGSLGRGLPVLVGCGRGLRLTAPLTLEHCLKHLWEGTHLVILVQRPLVTLVLQAL